MNKAMSTGAKVATWTVAGLLVLGAGAGVASAVTSHHTTAKSGSGSSGQPGYGGPSGYGFGGPGGSGAPGGESGSTSGTRPSFPGGHRPGGGFGGFGGGFGFGFGGRGVVHGEETIKVNGKYEVVDQQSGTVTTVSASSITVTSSDKYAATYAINKDTKIFGSGKTITAADLKTGQTVMVNATRSGTALTATAIAEGTFPMGPMGGRMGGTHPGPLPSGAPTTAPSGAPTTAPTTGS